MPYEVSVRRALLEAATGEEDHDGQLGRLLLNGRERGEHVQVEAVLALHFGAADGDLALLDASIAVGSREALAAPRGERRRIRPPWVLF